MRLHRRLIQPPRIHPPEGADRRVSWLECFYDLVFAVAIGQLASRLNLDFSALGAFKFAIVATIIWWAWVGQTFYLTRFDSDDLLHRVLTLVQMFFVAALATQITTGLEVGSARMALLYACIRLILVLEYTRVGRHSTHVRPLAWGYAAGFSISIVLWGCSAMTPSPLRFVLWGLALTIDYSTPLVLRAQSAIVPPHTTHLPERFGLFTLIVLGETVSSVVSGLGAGFLTPGGLGCALFGWITAVGIWWAYFEGIRGAAARSATSSQGAKLYRMWMYAHLPLMISIVALGVCLKRAIPLGAIGRLSVTEAWVFATFTYLAMACMNVISMANTRPETEQEMRRILRPHKALNLLVPLTALVSPYTPAIVPIAIGASVWVAHGVLTLRDDASAWREARFSPE